jgi:hypothetical protein
LAEFVIVWLSRNMIAARYRHWQGAAALGRRYVMSEVDTDLSHPSDSETDTANASWVDDEFAGKHGTTAADSSLTEEKHPDVHPQSMGDAATKVQQEASGETTVVDKAKKALQEVDRQVGGRYEEREDGATAAKDER